MAFMEISVIQGASQGHSKGRSFLARAFDLARPGVVAPPLQLAPNPRYSGASKSSRMLI